MQNKKLVLLIGIFILLAGVAAFLAGRMFNYIVLQLTSLKTGGQGIVVHKNEDGNVSPSPIMDFGSMVEVVLTNATTIYRCDTTPQIKPSAGDNASLQQTVERTSLDELITQSYVSVWGRKSGDRIIAEVVLVDVPVTFKSP